MSRYRLRTATVEAVQWTGGERQARELAELDGVHYEAELAGPTDPISGDDWGLLTVAGAVVNPRDHILAPEGRRPYHAPRDAFEALYEQVPDA